ncbi:MAG: hypothetical protein IKQ70_00180 [Bacteroidales bacterium]|nr:hypothetical protein [Bacteroidales bacterium]MBQ3616717.1 hypothetical protein [Bacteroidales bacterium]MBR6176280.1 hypothetical protein [Bacteroidales bacterium]
METTEIINIFSTFGFPTAMVIVMGYAMWKMYKSNEKSNRETVAESIKIRDQYISYIQMSNVEITGTLKESTVAAKENAAALKDNAAALNRFAVVLERLEKKIDNE